ncbi:hypothetical protein DPEC_G00257470 [Dallia pectoralis]|uniref:Uncharacterized protein n=1 Tax=Dallia pectoralis TaxID=75939 RepID=A0ACC2FQV0_DALPE|nr:hypothetical protein DPEC_G00257470 [Dallia pectoralis]
MHSSLSFASPASMVTREKSHQQIESRQHRLPYVASPSSSSSPDTVAGEGASSVTLDDVGSSTSASLVSPSSHDTPVSSAISDPLVRLSTSHIVPTDGQIEGKTEIYDPVHHTDGERDVGVPDADEEEGEKYDPFDPTGSPPSEREEVGVQGEARKGREGEGKQREQPRQ